VDTGAQAGRVPVERVEVRAYQIPTDGPDGKESDGTLEWDATTCVVVLASAAGHTGLGYTYTYGDVAAAHLIGSARTVKANASSATPWSI
jgi:hypothetical protein